MNAMEPTEAHEETFDVTTTRQLITYWAALKASDMPDDLVRDLVIDFQRGLLSAYGFRFPV